MSKEFHSNIFLVLLLLAFIVGCKQNTPTPKPKGYFRIDLPVKDSVRTFFMDVCDFTFQYPNYADIEQDTLYFDEKPDHPCWLNIQYPMLNGMVHMSYKPLSENNLEQLTEDYHRMKNKHVVKADFIDDAEIRDTVNHKYGLISSVGGNVASAYQFYITDSVHHYVRGSLYFKTQANADSLKPSVQFVRTDLIDMMESWQWK